MAKTAQSAKTISDKSLTPVVENFVSNWIGQYYGRREVRISREQLLKFEEMLRLDSVSGLALLVRILFICRMIGNYLHDEESIQDEIRSSLTRMKGTRNSALYKILTYIPFGWSFCHKIFDISSGKASLDRLQLINPLSYDFEGTTEGIQHIRYYDQDKDILIPYRFGLHLRNEEHLLLDNSPEGLPACVRVEPYWDLHKITIAATAVAIQRQATPILVGKTNTALQRPLLLPNGDPMINPATGQPLTATQAEDMRDMLLTLSNNSVAVIDHSDEILAIAQQTDGKFFQELLYYCAMKRMEGFLVPATLYAINPNVGSGDSNLSKSHQALFRDVCRQDAEYVVEAIIDGPIRDQLEFNHGVMDDYGRFEITTEHDEGAAELLAAITNAVQGGVFSAEDEKVIRRASELAGIL